MLKKDFNTRLCFISRQRYKKENLLRFVKKDNQVLLDINNNLLGRGFYVYPSQANYQKMIKSKVVARILKTEITDEQYENWKTYFNL